MSLTKDQLIQLQSSAKAQKVFGFEMLQAFATLHRNYPTRSMFPDTTEGDAEFEKAKIRYNREISVRDKLAQSLRPQGQLEIFAVTMLIVAVSSYENLNIDGQDEDALIDGVIEYEDTEGVNMIQTECAKLLKGWSFKVV